MTSCILNVSFSASDTIGMSTADGGATWSPIGLPEGVTSVDSHLTCVASSCVSAGQSTSSTGGNDVILFSADGGLNWRLASLPPDVGATGSEVPCVGRHCADVFASVGAAQAKTGGDTLITSSDGGESWTVAAMPSTTYRNILVPTCTGTVCTTTASVSNTNELASDQLLKSTDGGSTWTSTPLPSPIRSVQGPPTCFQQTCFLSAETNAIPTTGQPNADALITSDDGGQSWHVATLPTGVTQPEGPTCSSRICVLVATDRGQPVALVSDHAGTQWIRSSLPHGVTPQSGAVCWSDGCLLAGSTQGTSANSSNRLLYANLDD